MRAMLHSPEKKQLIIKYLTTKIDYNRNATFGKAINIPKPKVCSHWGLKDCRIARVV